jgi:adenosine deaminase
MDIDSLSKAELHLHLDCSLSYDVVRRIDPSVTEGAYREEFIAPAKCSSLVEFLTRAPRGVALMQTEEQLRLVTLDVFEQLQRDNVIYAEIRFAPLLHLQKGLTPEQVVEAVNAATEEGMRQTGIEARLILCTMRHYSEEQSLQTVKLVERYQGTLVAALDIAGDEAGCPIVPHVKAFQYAQEKGLARTAHAGEAAGPESVWETLRLLQPSRIGHGVHSIKDPMLVDHLREHHIHLEMCPTSNVQTDAVDTYADHPIERLFEAGVPLNVNTDTRTIADITLDEEYRRMHETFGWDAQRFLETNLAAVEAAFLPEDVKERLRSRLQGSGRA